MSKINASGTYKVKLRIIDVPAYVQTHDGNEPTWKTKTVERWLNTDAEMNDLFLRWERQGIEAILGRFVGR